MSLAVIIPTYHRPEGLRAALDSVLAQSRLPEEIVVVDNSAEATARPVCADYHFDGLVYIHEPRHGCTRSGHLD